MDFLELSKKRCSVRKYSDKPVEEEKLQKILEAGRLAPTATNAQPQRIYVFKTVESLEKMRGLTKMAFNAPIIMLICYDQNVSWKSRFGDAYDAGDMDASIVCTAMMMEATELGLGTLWVRGYNSNVIEEAFELPENIKSVCMLLVGYTAEDYVPSPKHFDRLPLSETVTEL